MPASSEQQKKFFGAVMAYKKGRLKDASPAVTKAAGSIGTQDASDFASEPVKKKRTSLASSMARY